jgi:hypothetical protein
MLEKNYATVRQANGMDVETQPFKDKLKGILEQFALNDLRGNKMDTDDILNALSIFARNGIHFN